VANGLLNKLGLQADFVENGSLAVDALRKTDYDLVLMDVQMPELDGLEATAIIRNTRSGVINSTVPIIAMTAHAMQDDREKCLNAGMNDYVTKPISLLALSAVLQKWLPLKEFVKNDEVYPIQEQANYFSPSASPVFDKSDLYQRMMDDEDLITLVVNSFLSEMPEQIKELRAVITNQNQSLIVSHSHTIKGVCANLSAESMREIAAFIEKNAAAGNLEQTFEMMAKLETEFEKVRLEMNALNG